MKCPYCGKEMKKGYMTGGSQPVQWIPEGKKPSIWKGVAAKDGVELGYGDLWDGFKADAFYCQACKVVIVPEKHS